MDRLADFCELLACVFLGALALVLLFKIATDKIDLEWLVSEDNGHASISRFQLLIFSFVVAISLVKIVEEKKEFPKIDSSILTLLGISASTYAVGKSIQKAGQDNEPVAPNSPRRGPNKTTPAPDPRAAEEAPKGKRAANADERLDRPE